MDLIFRLACYSTESLTARRIRHGESAFNKHTLLKSRPTLARGKVQGKRIPVIN
jgi:hypothetical protein